MPALVQCAGADVQSGRISLGIRGPWWAELTIATDTPPSGQVKIEADGGLALTGTVTDAGAYQLTTRVRVVGGAGGLGKLVRGAYSQAQLRDPLGAILSATGEVQSSSIASSILSVPLARWTLGQAAGARALDQLAAAATAYLSQPVGWRVLADGTVWMGVEAWPSNAMPDDSVIADFSPAEARAVIGCATPALLPGVDLEGVGRVQGVDHWISPERVRSYLWM